MRQRRPQFRHASEVSDLQRSSLCTIPALLGLLAAGVVHAQAVNIPAGASFNLGDGQARLACATVTVAGLLSGGNGVVDQAGDVYIASGTVSGDSADFFVSGDWSNAGTFTPGTSLVEFTDACALDTVLSGNTTFYDLRFVSSTGKTFLLQSGATQTVRHALTVQGGPGNNTHVDNTGTTPAFIDARGGSVSMANADTAGADVVFLSNVAPVPGLSGTAMAMLAAMLAFVAPALRRRSARAR